VAWSGADLTGIVSLRDSCKARDARQVLWLGEGCAKGFLVFFNPASFRSRLHLSRHLSTLRILFPEPSATVVLGFVGFRWILVVEEGIRGFRLVGFRE
jgi:hypothetical protein